MLTKLTSLWYPERFQGWGKTRRYFEGWYFKIVSPNEDHALAFIPGIALESDSGGQAFIQVMEGKACRSEFHTFDLSQFSAAKDAFELRIGNNFFSAEKMQLDLPGWKGEIRFNNLVPWPKMLGAPGIMGWYSFVPFMECKHGIVSMYHDLAGTLELQQPDQPNRTVSFDGGRGYLEKDWGVSFPRAYVWIHSNHFENTEKASLFASIAHIPWLGSYFIGFISGFWLGGRLFKFATYNGSKYRFSQEADQLTLVLKNSRHELRISASQAPGTPLRSPITGEMRGKIQESLLAKINLELYENGRRIYEGAGRNTGLEVAGNTEILLSR